MNRGISTIAYTMRTVANVPWRIVVFLYLLLAYFSSAHASGIEAADFQVTMELEFDLEPGTVAKLPVDADLVRYSQRFPDDLRIFDADGNAWPFFLHMEEVSSEAWVEASWQNPVWVSGENAGDVFECEVIVPSGDAGPLLHNGMEILTTGENYFRRVELGLSEREGANFAWGYLVADDSSTTHSRIEYASSNFRHIRMRIHSSASNSRERFQLIAVRLRRVRDEPQRTDWQNLPYTRIDPDVSEQGEGHQVWMMDLGQSALPVERIRFEVEDPGFERNVRWYGRDATGQRWQWLGSDTLYRKPGARKLQMESLQRPNAYRFLKITEHHQDDAPLEVTKIDLGTRQRWLVFEVGSDLPAQLCVGHTSLRGANFDLKKRVTPDQIGNAPVVQVSAHVELREPSIWKRYDHLFVIGVTALAVGVVLWVIVGMMRRVGGVETNRDEDG